jgi:nitroreductase
MNAISATRNVPTTALDGFANVIKGSLDALTDEQKTTWAQKQCYIALANLISAASLLKIDACPMEGFNAAEFNKILGLDEKGLTATVIAPVGYRNIEDKTQHAAKVRKSTQELFTTIK